MAKLLETQWGYIFEGVAMSSIVEQECWVITSMYRGLASSSRS